MESYSIIDLEKYAISMRDAAASSFEKSYTENLDEFITVRQVINLINNHNLGRDADNNLIINEEIFNDIFDEIRDWLYSAALAKLASKGLVDCAWDDQSNSMIFWLADKNKTKISAKPSQDIDE